MTVFTRKSMDDEEFDELTEEQLAALDSDVARVTINNKENGNSQGESSRTTLAPSQSQTDIFAEITNTQFAVIDRDVGVKTRENQEGSDRHENDDDFGQIANEQLEAIDRSIIPNNEEVNDRESPNTTAVVSNSGTIVPEIADLELTWEAFEDDDGSEPSLEHLECLRSKVFF